MRITLNNSCDDGDGEDKYSHDHRRNPIMFVEDFCAIVGYGLDSAVSPCCDDDGTLTDGEIEKYDDGDDGIVLVEDDDEDGDFFVSVCRCLGDDIVCDDDEDEINAINIIKDDDYDHAAVDKRKRGDSATSWLEKGSRRHLPCHGEDDESGDYYVEVSICHNSNCNERVAAVEDEDDTDDDDDSSEELELRSESSLYEGDEYDDEVVLSPAVIAAMEGSTTAKSVDVTATTMASTEDEHEGGLHSNTWYSNEEGDYAEYDISGGVTDQCIDDSNIPFDETHDRYRNKIRSVGIDIKTNRNGSNFEDNDAPYDEPTRYYKRRNTSYSATSRRVFSVVE